MTELMNTLEGAAVNAAAGSSSARQSNEVVAADAGSEVNVAAVESAATDTQEESSPSVTVDPNIAEQGEYSAINTI